MIKAKPQKKIPETDAIFANIKEQDGNAVQGIPKGQILRLSMDCTTLLKYLTY